MGCGKHSSNVWLPRRQTQPATMQLAHTAEIGSCVAAFSRGFCAALLFANFHILPQPHRKVSAEADPLVARFAPSVVIGIPSQAPSNRPHHGA